MRVKARLHKRKYPTGVSGPDEEMKTLELTPRQLHGDWNYTLAV